NEQRDVAGRLQKTHRYGDSEFQATGTSGLRNDGRSSRSRRDHGGKTNAIVDRSKVPDPLRQQSSPQGSRIRPGGKPNKSVIVNQDTAPSPLRPQDPAQSDRADRGRGLDKHVHWTESRRASSHGSQDTPQHSEDSLGSSAPPVTGQRGHGTDIKKPLVKKDIKLKY
ncbi:MAG: hypothetical protein Q9183_005600, partial [Haloplaca sp. 2 TL-2023]